MQLSQQLVLVTGGARGLGQHVTRAFAREGAQMVINHLHSVDAAQALAGDFGPDGITVNMLSGGLLRSTDASAATPAAAFDYIAANTPLRSVTMPAEFADAVLFFASPWSRAVTGQNLVVDGGLVRH